MSEVLVDVVAGTGRVILNRPKAINALTLDMLEILDVTLRAWLTDERVTQVELSGAGERGLCAGADVKALRAAVLAGGDPRPFLAFEYALDALIATYPKPFTARMDGFTMGGGLGLSAHASRRIVTSTSRLAMPETIIGLIPDVGVLFELSRAPGEWGTHLALTGATIGAADAIAVGLADVCEGDPGRSRLAQATWIDECYAGDDPVAIVEALERHPDPDARDAALVLRQRCPFSVAAALAAIRRAARLSDVTAVLAQDLRSVPRLARRPDFLEGVRAQVVEKDRNPRWSPARIEDVPPDEIAQLFAD